VQAINKSLSSSDAPSARIVFGGVSTRLHVIWGWALRTP
jgi:hypothetical protein